MLQAERQEIILKYLSSHDYLELSNAVAMFNSSPATINRDFNDLSERELVERVRGGIRPRVGQSGMIPFELRESLYSAEKERLAIAAVNLINPGDVIFVDGGTTTFHMGMCMPKAPLRLITNSLRLATLLEEKTAGQPELEISLTGGYLYKQSGILLGPNAKDTLSKYHANWAFLSVGGIDKAGISNTNELVTETERTMIQNAEKTVILADHSKLGKTAMCQICPLSEIDILITNHCPEKEDLLAEYRSIGIKIIEQL